MIDSGLCSTEINRRIGRVVRDFRWAVSEELVPSSVSEALRTVPGLRRGRSEARESAPVRPVPDEHVEAIRPHVARQVWAMIELQRLTAMRPGEVCSMRTRDVDRSGPIHLYSPESHKTEHHGRARVIHLGPRAQDAVRPWLRDDAPDAYLFSPAEAMAERHARQRRARKTPVQPSQRDRAMAAPKKVPSPCYTTESYRRAIAYACRKAGVPGWHPHQLRYAAATRLRREFGLDVTRAVLGHSTPVVTEVYAELDAAEAAEAMSRIG